MLFEELQSKGTIIYFEDHSHLHMNVIHEVEMRNESHFNHEDGNNEVQTNSRTSIESFRPASLEILDHVKINVTTPDIKGILLSSKSGQTFTKKELRKAEEQLSNALKEFYHKLRLLKRYRLHGFFIPFLA